MELRETEAIWIGLICLRIGIAGFSCEYGRKPSCSIKGGKFDYPSDYQFLKRDSVPCS
jgi:hypothetical protein